MYFCPVTVLGLHCYQRGTMWSSNQSLAWRQPQTYDDKPNHGMPCLASTRHATPALAMPCHASADHAKDSKLGRKCGQCLQT